MALRPEQQTYVFTLDAVHRATVALSARPIHEHFPGYLAVLRARRRNGGEPAAMSDIAEFHDRYLKAPGYPEASPFIRPFKSRGRGLEAFNSNVAGSYAPSSLRAKGKLINVIAVEGSRNTATYDLLDGHADEALENLLMDVKVPVVALTASIYRDYGIRMAAPRIVSVVNLFRDEFGFRAENQNESDTFGVLFSDDREQFSEDDFEVVRDGTAADG